MAKGLFTPKNPEKYLGDITKIRFLSSWELKFMIMCDTNPYILKWGSEEFRVKYWNPLKNKVCDYIPDFIIKYKNKHDEVITEVIEIKPKKQSVISKKMSDYDKAALIVNQAKWSAAVSLCESYGIKFRVLTEEELFG